MVWLELCSGISIFISICFWLSNTVRTFGQDRQPGIFKGRGVFLELGHFAKHSPITQERKAPQGKIIRFFRLETFKNQGIFFHRSGHFSNFWRRAGETSPPSLPLVTRMIWNRVFELIQEAKDIYIDNSYWYSFL